MSSSPLGPSFSVSPAGSKATSTDLPLSFEELPATEEKPPLDGWETASQVANWLLGKERDKALEFIRQAYNNYKEFTDGQGSESSAR